MYYLLSYFSTVNLLIKRPFFCVINRSRTHLSRPLSQERVLLSKACLREALRRTSASSYLRNSSLTSIKMDAPTQDLRNDLLSSGFRRLFASRRLCAFGCVATVIFIAISRMRGSKTCRKRHCEEGNFLWILV